MKISKLSICPLALGVVALVLAGCGGNQETAENAPTSAPAGGAPAGKMVDPTTAGSITGSVMLEGAAPRMRPINMAAEPACAKAHSSPVLSEEVVTGDGGSLANVVVYVKTGLEGYSFPAPTGAVELDQKGCQYIPHVLALRAGQNLEVVNNDPTTHNVHPVPADNREWNESQPPNAAAIDRSFARPEIAIPVKCNVHPWMKSYVAVLPNPAFQVTGKDGAFNLSNLPPGDYTLVAWHELYGTSEQNVTIGSKESKSVMFTFKASAPSGD